MKYTCQILFFTSFFLAVSIKTEAQTNISGIINTYYKATAIVSGIISGNSYSGITLQNITGLSKDDRVMIIQMKGAVIDETNSASFGNITSIGNAGKYEFSSICGFLNNTIVLSNQLLNTYDAALIQVVRVPVYQDANVVGTLQPQAWDPLTGTGGVLALEVTGTLTLNADIDASGTGFKGGQLFVNTTGRSCPTPNYYYSVLQSTAPSIGAVPKGEGIAQFITSKEHGAGKQANGGGGANLDNNGGGGGGNYGVGGVGGRKPFPAFCPLLGVPTAAPNAQGGLALGSVQGYTNPNNRIFLGGGGGCGEMNNYENPPANTIPSGTPGGNGGGILYIKCNQITGNNFFIRANGTQGINPSLSPTNASKSDGGGGGGAGGVVLLNCNTYSGSLTVEARGAAGCNAGLASQCGLGPGGGGGGGVIWHTGTISATTNVSNGSNGVVTSCSNTPNGATAGSSGIVQTGFVAPQGTIPFNCAILSIESLKEWWGKKVTNGIQLKWKLEQTDGIDEIWLEKKTVRGPFKTMKIYEQPAEGFYEYRDESNDLPATYRLLVISRSGKKEYSSQLFFESEKVKRLHVYPNPVKDELRIQLPVTSFGRTVITIFDYTGKLVASKECMLNTNQQVASIETAHLPAGTYTVKCYWRDELYIAKIIKQ
jgi:Secretion system C-terminal sorting domain